MAFTTNIFLFVFLPICLSGYYLVHLFKRIKLNNIYLILVSLVFYAWAGIDKAAYMIIFVLLVYVFAHLIERTKEIPSRQHKCFAFSIIVVLGILFYYKYVGFIIENVNSLLATEFSIPEFIVPVGLSFVVFESVSYLTDIYWSEKTGVKAGNLLDTALFLLFFPKVISGPIVLWRDFESQIAVRNHSVDKFCSGVERIMIGFVKKVIIADTLGGVVSTILYDFEIGIDQWTAILGALCYTIQLYYDFSGYSDIAIGVGRLFGFDIKENFNFPYISKSITEFWRRWHISLGSWFREYLYIPLGGNRSGNVYLNLFIVFLATGIWHGASWNFVLWGVLHAILIVVERRVRNCQWYIKIPSACKWMFTMVFVYLTWIIFMTPDLSTAGLYLKTVFVGTDATVNFTYRYYFDKKIVAFLVIGVIGALIGKSEKLKNKILKWTENTVTGFCVKEGVLVIGFVLAIVFMVNSTYSPFLYFQF